MIKNIYFLLFLALLNYCSDGVIPPNSFEQLETEIRMEVQVLDSTYQLYSRPFTDIYFTAYKLTDMNERVGFDQSDTTSCQNGWGVKLLNFTFDNPNEVIILGASCEEYNGANYREIEIHYSEAEQRIDSTNHASIIKTFAIYWQ